MKNTKTPLSKVRVALSSNGGRPTIWVKALRLPEVWMHSSANVFTDYDTDYDPLTSKREAVEANPSVENINALAEAVARSNHYAILNCCLGVPGMRWPVTEAIYWEFLEMLPPMSYSAKPEGFRMCEASHEDADGRTVRSAYYREKGHYWHEYVADEVKKND